MWVAGGVKFVEVEVGGRVSRASGFACVVGGDNDVSICEVRGLCEGLFDVTWDGWFDVGKVELFVVDPFGNLRWVCYVVGNVFVKVVIPFFGVEEAVGVE